MALICIQCAIKAFALNEPPPAPTDETNEAHIARLHADLAQTQRERVQYERLAAERIARERP